MLAELIQRTSEKIIAIGAGLEVWLRATEKIIFSPEPCHTPDKQFINKLVDLLSSK